MIVLLEIYNDQFNFLKHVLVEDQLLSLNHKSSSILGFELDFYTKYKFSSPFVNALLFTIPTIKNILSFNYNFALQEFMVFQDVPT